MLSSQLSRLDIVYFPGSWSWTKDGEILKEIMSDSVTDTILVMIPPCLQEDIQLGCQHTLPERNVSVAVRLCDNIMAGLG